MSEPKAGNSRPSLEITGDSKPSVPVFTCLVYIRKNEDGTLTGRVANFEGIEASGTSERFVLGSVTREFKSRILKMVELGQDISLNDSPDPPNENELVRSIPMHL